MDNNALIAFVERLLSHAEDVIKAAKVNKVLYLLGLGDFNVQQSQEWQELAARRVEQRKAIIEVAEVAEKSHVELMVVKTLKPFDYVPDDIDLLVIDDSQFNDFVQEMLRRGYFLRKKGTPEVTLRKVIKNTFVDLDIHFKMGAGPYEYIDKHYLWKRRIHVELDGVKIAKPNQVDELLITAAHAVMKELTITIADILHALSLDSHTRKESLAQARKIGLYNALKFLLDTATKTLQATLLNRPAPRYPIRVPPYIIAQAYAENLSHRIKTQGLTPLKETLTIPSSKGIGTVLRYVGL